MVIEDTVSTKFEPRSSIVKNFFDCCLPGVKYGSKNNKIVNVLLSASIMQNVWTFFSKYIMDSFCYSAPVQVLILNIRLISLAAMIRDLHIPRMELKIYSLIFLTFQ